MTIAMAERLPAREVAEWAAFFALEAEEARARSKGGPRLTEADLRETDHAGIAAFMQARAGQPGESDE